MQYKALKREMKLLKEEEGGREGDWRI